MTQPRPETLPLDNLTLSRKEGLKALAEAPKRQPPELLTVRQKADLSEPARLEYEKHRSIWHANLGPIKTPQLTALNEDLWDIVDSNQQDGDKAKGAVAVDAFPGLGKTTAVLDFALKYHRKVIERDGAFTAAGHERWPVCRVGLTSNIGMKEFNRSLLEYYAHPGRKSGTAALFAQRALDCVLECETRILVIDDLHFLKWHDRNGTEVSNHFKYIANEFPVTIIFIGVELAGRGLYSEANSRGNITLAQTARRTTPLSMEPFTVTNDKHRREWRRMLLALEQRIVLCRKFPGMLADELRANRLPPGRTPDAGAPRRHPGTRLLGQRHRDPSLGPSHQSRAGIRPPDGGRPDPVAQRGAALPHRIAHPVDADHHAVPGDRPGLQDPRHRLAAVGRAPQPPPAGARPPCHRARGEPAAGQQPDRAVRSRQEARQSHRPAHPDAHTPGAARRRPLRRDPARPDPTSTATTSPSTTPADGASITPVCSTWKSGAKCGTAP
ncbi:TniB family NTP-binding protein [Streptomyces sp. NPDC056154]|uniref:TniB family NTP-binding protein n=1 Tax=unclassified Streptomyces TaxID=2593676 RepID=UPI0035D57AEB